MQLVPEDVNWTVCQGAAWQSDDITVLESENPDVPFDWTGYTAVAQVRKKPESTAILATMAVTFDADRTSGAFSLSLTGAQTAGLPSPAALWYDVKMTKANDPASPVVPMRGTLQVLHSVTRT